MELTKSDIKYLTKLLNAQLNESKRIAKRNEENLANPNLPDYTQEVYDRQLRKINNDVEQCESILKRLR